MNSLADTNCTAINVLTFLVQTGDFSFFAPQNPRYSEVNKIVAQKESVTLEELESELNFVQKGGRWKPSQCEAKRKVSK